MDWRRFFHFLLSAFRDLISRRMVILVLTAVIVYQATGILYSLLKLQLIRTRPAMAALERGDTAQAREPADVYRVIPERNLFGTTTSMMADRQAGALQQDIALPIELRGTVAGEAMYLSLIHI